MIQTKKDLKEYLEYERYLYYSCKSRRDKILQVLTNTEDARFWKYIKLLRKSEFYYNQKHNPLCRILFLIYCRRKNIYGGKIGVTVPENTTEKGLRIYHSGIVIHPCAKCGENLMLHGANCIGNNGKIQKAPQLGNSVDVGYGAVIIGEVELADGIIVGAGAVVTKSFRKKNSVVRGIPATQNERLD